MFKTKRSKKSRAKKIYLFIWVFLLGLALSVSHPATAGRRKPLRYGMKKAAKVVRKISKETKKVLDESTTILSAKAQRPAYELAQGCYALKSLKNKSYLVAVNGSNYKFADVGEVKAEKFFLKPAGLGSFMLYDRNGKYLAVETPEEDFDFDVDVDFNEFNFDPANGQLDVDLDASAHVGYDFDGDVLSVNRKKRVSRKAIWKINYLDIYQTKISVGGQKKEKIDTGYTLVSAHNNMRLVMRFSQPELSMVPLELVQKVDPQRIGFHFVKQDASECKQYPEASVNATVFPEYYEPKDPTKPVKGFIDTHAHLSFPKSMAGVAMAGDLFHPLGIEHALKDCSQLHGEGGKMDILGASVGGGVNHETTGYPNFSADWPSSENVTHANAYYKWIERAHLSGMKMLVTFVTGHKTMCELFSLIHPLKAEGDCKSDDVINLQISYLYALQDYVDAQEGGPGKGWFRIVRSPEEARDVISQNKLAVLLGVEYNTLFDCKTGADYCTEEYIDKELDLLYDMGVRVVFPMHKLDNSFGGAIAQPGDSGGWFNLTNKMSSGKIDHFTEIVNPFLDSIGGDFWQFEECPEGVDGVTDVKNMKDFMDDDFIISRNMLKRIPTVGPLLVEIFDWVFVDKLGPLPTYEEFDGKSMCNSRSLQPMGRYLINQLIDRGMLIETDHMGYHMLQETLDILEQRDYSGVVSSHSISFLNDDVVARILELGGHISPMARSFSKTLENIERYTVEMSDHPYWIGVGIGTDVQGMCPQGNAPQGIDVYGAEGFFTSFDGNVEFTMQQTGNRAFNFNEEGRAHYGLIADWIEAVRQDNPGALESIMNSAEAYLRMWERATE